MELQFTVNNVETAAFNHGSLLYIYYWAFAKAGQEDLVEICSSWTQIGSTQLHNNQLTVAAASPPDPITYCSVLFNGKEV